ncbi:hypothetical protein AB4430_21605 [Vibrio kanaloae]|uniref:hypothetical protein n=1 Tax=Vibrio kanaloae TaxID=170673 RepID=UPI0018E470A5|nr:hypothetical protein [Vibrio kanaloae]
MDRLSYRSCIRISPSNNSSMPTIIGGFVAPLNLGGLLIRLGDSVAIGHPDVGEAI